jgi:hypothetical protein
MIKSEALLFFAGSFAAHASAQIDFGRPCEPPGCVGVIAPPPLPAPWTVPRLPKLRGAEWTIGKTIKDLRARWPSKKFIVVVEPAADETGIVDVKTSTCIVSFYTKATGQQAEVWHVSGFSLKWDALVDDSQARQCAASLLEG